MVIEMWLYYNSMEIFFEKGFFMVQKTDKKIVLKVGKISDKIKYEQSNRNNKHSETTIQR